MLERDETGPGLLLAVRGIELDLVLARVHGHDAVVAQLLAADRGNRLRILGHLRGSVHDLGHGHILALVRVDDSHLRAVEGREDVALEGHGGAQRVVAVDDQEQHPVAVRQVGHGEGAGAGIAQAELELVAALQGHREVVAGLVGHGELASEALGAAVDFQGAHVREGVAHAELVLELQGGHEAADVQRFVGHLVGAVSELHLAGCRQGARHEHNGLQTAECHFERGGDAIAIGASLP
mmetsp:Transcript_21676/g.60307  ORF Transcript_21676/g.60307 Transcript_21676/m.60307 type:complete len:238 (+) Transcript_21676:230-943(+)